MSSILAGGGSSAARAGRSRVDGCRYGSAVLRGGFTVCTGIAWGSDIQACKVLGESGGHMPVIARLAACTLSLDNRAARPNSLAVTERSSKPNVTPNTHAVPNTTPAVADSPPTSGAMRRDASSAAATGRWGLCGAAAASLQSQLN
jgi:hypothetical protein